MTEKEVLEIATGRLQRAVSGDLETILLDGKPLVTFWPIDVKTEILDSQYHLISSRKYILHG